MHSPVSQALADGLAAARQAQLSDYESLLVREVHLIALDQTLS
jgi:hypothetical protein